MQTKEKKWMEIEALLIPLYDKYPVLMEKVQELKIEISPTARISSVVGMNERLHKRVKREQHKLEKLRARLLNPNIVQPLKQKQDKSFNESSDYENGPQGKRFSRSYVEQLEEALAKAHQLLDDKWFDLKQIMRMHQLEIHNSLHLELVLEEVKWHIDSLFARSEVTAEDSLCETCQGLGQFERIVQLLLEINQTPNILQEISQFNESNFFHPSSSLDESKMAESEADFTIILQKPYGSVKTRISRIKRMSQYSVVKDPKLDESKSMDDFFPQ